MVIKNPNAIYTQEDYDKVTDLYNTYQQSKDKYTPEQQKEIERKFAEAWVAASNRIEDYNKKFIDMWNDEQGNIPTYQSPYSGEDRRYSGARNAEYGAGYIDQFDNKNKK